MIRCYADNGYLLDPHGAIGFAGLKKYVDRKRENGVFLETAHPAKFGNIVELAGLKYKMPGRLSKCIDKEKKAILMENDFMEFRKFLKEYSLIRP